MSFEADHSPLLRLSDELFLQLRCRQVPCKVHDRSIRFVGDGSLVESRMSVNDVIGELCLRLVERLDRRKSAFLLNPFERLAKHKDGKDGGRIEKRFSVYVRLVLQHRRNLI